MKWASWISLRTAKKDKDHWVFQYLAKLVALALTMDLFKKNKKKQCRVLSCSSSKGLHAVVLVVLLSISFMTNDGEHLS